VVCRRLVVGGPAGELVNQRTRPHRPGLLVGPAPPTTWLALSSSCRSPACHAAPADTLPCEPRSAGVGYDARS
jgi:hypothetical protein